MGNPLKMKAKISQNLRPNNNVKDKSKNYLLNKDLEKKNQR
jgi:hypothetical protein